MCSVDSARKYTRKRVSGKFPLPYQEFRALGLLVHAGDMLTKPANCTLSVKPCRLHNYYVGTDRAIWVGCVPEKKKQKISSNLQLHFFVEVRQT